MKPTDSNWGLSPRSDNALRLQAFRKNNPEGWDALIKSDLEVMKQPIFDSPYDGYDSIDDIPTDYTLAHGQLLANLSGDDGNPNDIWALAEGDYTVLDRFPENKRETAFRICDRLEESGEWQPKVIPDWDALNKDFPSTQGIWDGELAPSLDDVFEETEPDLANTILVNPGSTEKTYTSPYQEYRGWNSDNQPEYDEGEEEEGKDMHGYYKNSRLSPATLDFLGIAPESDETGYAIVEFPEF
jgi:hypothetical protein